MAFTPSLKFRQPQSVPSGTGEHTVLESSVFPPASLGRRKNQSKFSAGFTHRPAYYIGVRHLPVVSNTAGPRWKIVVVSPD